MWWGCHHKSRMNKRPREVDPTTVRVKTAAAVDSLPTTTASELGQLKQQQQPAKSSAEAPEASLVTMSKHTRVFFSSNERVTCPDGVVRYETKLGLHTHTQADGTSVPPSNRDFFAGVKTVSYRPLHEEETEAAKKFLLTCMPRAAKWNNNKSSGGA